MSQSMLEKKEHSLWVEKYRPKTLDTYIGNSHIIEKVKIYLESNDIPHLLFHGIQGSGKTTIAKIIVNTIECDYLYINASDENGIDVIRNKIKNFASAIGFTDIKIIILDESDFLTPSAQAALRNTMETFSKHTRFIMTCNYIERIIPPIQSRCQTFGVSAPTKTELAVHLKNILDKEEVKFDIKDLATIISSDFPDIRKIINQAQLSSIRGKLKIDKESIISSNYMFQIKEVLLNKTSKEQKYKTIRQIITDNKLTKFEQLFKFMYDELDNLTDDYDKRVKILTKISDAAYWDAFFIDKEINVVSMFVKIIDIMGS